MLRKAFLLAVIVGGACGPDEEGPTPAPLDAAQSPSSADGGPGALADAGSIDAGSTPNTAGDTGTAPKPDASSGGVADSGASGPRPDGGSAEAGAPNPNLAKFSFFVTSLAALRKLANNQAGFGGDLRFGETGDGAGLRGADKICTTIAETSMPGSGAKQWRAFLSTSKVHAKDRIGQGPWYDRKGRVLAMNLTALIKERPEGADPLIINDFPNELGVPNHDPDGTGQVDNHDMLTGSNAMGMLFNAADSASSTCKDWTSAERIGRPRVGHSWPRSGGAGFPMPGGGGFPGGGGGFPGGMGGGSGPGGTTAGGGIGGGDGNTNNWMSALNEAGCAPEVSIIEMGPPNYNNPTVGSGGGYGGFYCFALTP